MDSSVEKNETGTRLQAARSNTSTSAFLPALTNAIADAIGLRFNNLPVTPDRVFAALEKRARDRKAERVTNGGGRS